jgi:hypothetical protein
MRDMKKVDKKIKGLVVYEVEEGKVEEIIFSGKYIVQSFGRKMEWKMRNIRTGYEFMMVAVADE